MAPRKLSAQPIYLEPEKAGLLKQLTAQTRIPKAVLLREAVDDLLARNGMGEFSTRVSTVREALKKAAPPLAAYLKLMKIKGEGSIPIKSCQEAIEAIVRAREEFGD